METANRIIDRLLKMYFVDGISRKQGSRPAPWPGKYPTRLLYVPGYPSKPSMGIPCQELLNRFGRMLVHDGIRNAGRPFRPSLMEIDKENILYIYTYFGFMGHSYRLQNMARQVFGWYYPQRLYAGLRHTGDDVDTVLAYRNPTGTNPWNVKVLRIGPEGSRKKVRVYTGYQRIPFQSLVAVKTELAAAYGMPS